MHDGLSGPRGRVILAKAGLDAHERGVHVVAHGLRNAGFEVIYLGLRRTPEQVVAAALQEDADVIGLSSLAGGHRHFSKAILDLLEPVDTPPLVVVGGLIPPDDEQEMLQAGVALVFNVESPVSGIVVALKEAVSERRRLLHA
ncbi:cobalamin B12-binding domain-containing protein [Conexibacter sp. DBS9H8]|uniref:cobalamin B12-binding domain-containing protein n=1 Tax=Conexibacter sp. DBS9H8 TaxID=2937801 RepID=UPI0020108B73|nr:cobalamin-dependent protein [Conexibacter sp. DBS9H8]